MASTGRHGGTRGGRSRASAEAAEFAEGVRRAALVAVFAYTAFVAVDVVLALLAYHDARLDRIIAFRMAGAGLFFGWLFWARAAHASLRTLVASTTSVLAASAVLLALIGNELGGLDSAYAQGPAFYFVGIAALAPSPWRRVAVILAPVYVAFFATLGLAAHADDPSAWASTELVSRFAVVMFIQAALLGFSAAASHLLWASRAQLYRARRLGRYRLQAPLGAGGMNEVWLGRDDNLQRDVAIKVLRDAPAADDERWQRFEREAQVSSSLTSPHTVEIYDYGASDDGIAYIAMELLRGLDLAELVQSFGPLDVRRAVHLIRQAASSLAEAHERGLVHRDVKPANVFALSTGEAPDFVKVLDFGLVRELVRPVGQGTREGVMLGTPAYMAPEQFLGADVGPAADVYGLAATLYYLLTGAPPFDDRGGGDAALWRAHTRDALVPVGRRRGDPVPAALETVIATAMAKDPAERYRDATAFGKALDAIELGRWTATEAAAWWTAARLTPVSARRRASSVSRAVTVDTSSGHRTPPEPS
ncbi:MAG TPA: serine/threonine-protein kinase [Kofleriaceae bacterium]|nr:serine/threonine-protein kinase [Kofleriaceae bacterium]